MQEKEINKFFEDLSFNSSFTFLEEGQYKKKLLEAASKQRIKLPAKDLAVFECIYAYTDRINKNGCNLPKPEVEKALDTLIGKAIDFDHYRKKIVGHWIDAKLDGNEIIAYGVFFKGSLPEDYQVIKELFDKGHLAISFEAWGERIYHDASQKTYDLTNIEMAGGALLIKEMPAFAGAGVLEMAKNKVLEFAQVMTKPQEFFHATDVKHKEIEEAQMHQPYDIQSVYKNLQDVPCMTCDNTGPYNLSSIDFVKNKAGIKCGNCGAEMMANLVPQTTQTKKGKIIKMSNMTYKGQIEDLDNFVNQFEGSDQALEIILEESLEQPNKLTYENRTGLTDEDFAIIANIGQEQKRKIRIFPIHDLAHIDIVNARLEKSHVEFLMAKLGVNKDNVKRKISRRSMTYSMKTLLEKYKKGTVSEVLQEIAKASIGREMTKEELEKAQLSVTSLQTLKKSNVPDPEGDHALTDIKSTPANDSHSHPSSAPSTDTSLQKAEVTEEEIETILSEATKPVVSDKDKEIARLTAELASITTELKEFRKQKEEAEKAARDAKIKARKDELAEFAKDMKDEEILDELKYENAKLKKENAALKGTKPATGSTTKQPDLTLASTTGSQQPVQKNEAQKVNDIFQSLLKTDTKEVTE